MILNTSELGLPLIGDGITGERFEERHRDALRAACAEDLDIWQIYSMNFGPHDFDRNIDLISANKRCRTFVLFEDDALVGMSSFLGIDEPRQVVEIGATYYRPSFRGTGFNARCKDMMLRRAFACGVRRVEFRVDV
ncbi:MAG: GNAT family N-acetyltransferase, partial [Sphingomonas sp.]